MFFTADCASARASCLEDQEAISAGLRHYAAMCVRCHGGTGVGAEEFAKGLNPSALEMEHIVKEFTAGEIFWITKHGIRMTGMPAFGTTYNDDELWKTVAFIQQISEMTDEQKQSWKEQVNQTGKGAQHSDTGTGFAVVQSFHISNQRS